jgi:hypothetical protein
LYGADLFVVVLFLSLTKRLVILNWRKIGIVC